MSIRSTLGRRALPAASVLLAAALAWGHPETAPPPASSDDLARRFLEVYESLYRGVATVANEAQWKAATDVTPEHDGARVAAGKALAAVQGDPLVIQRVRSLAAVGLDPVLARELDRVLLNAAETPGTIPEVVAERVEAESRQSSILDSFQFCLERKGDRCVRPVTANGIDDLLSTSRSLPERLAVWKASKESGAPLKPGLRTLRDLRNQVAREMGYPSYFDLEVADYGMTSPEMMAMLDRWIAETRPLFQQLHCYARYELAERYGKPVPARIPAHWIDNRWAQSWDGIVPGVDLDPLFRGKTSEWVVKQAESFYVSMGFQKLPETFWLQSDLYPVPEGSPRKKNTHASAWHVDLERDVRSLMSVEPNARWFQTAHHELGHIYYYLAYARPEVPVLLRGGANRGFHEGIGDLISIASMQPPYLRQIGLLPQDAKVDRIAWLMNEAFRSAIVYLPFAAGTMSHWERDLYAGDLPYDQWNRRWWDYAARYQGIDPPEARGEDSCDACTKTHVNDDPAQYYDYAVATVLKYQLHDHIARKILGVDPHEASYYGRKDVGDFLRSILEKGQTEDWRTLLKEATGEDLSTRAMVEYFRPLTEYLERANAGRSCDLP